MVAINLLKFKSPDGLAAYRKYMAAATAAAPADLKVLYTGKAGPDFGGGEDWDFVIIVEYASVDSFAAFVTSPEYRKQAVPHRASALERTLWMASFPAPLAALYAAHP